MPTDAAGIAELNHRLSFMTWYIEEFYWDKYLDTEEKLLDAREEALKAWKRMRG
jgi:hypothetical protein